MATNGINKVLSIVVLFAGAAALALSLGFINNSNAQEVDTDALYPTRDEVTRPVPKGEVTITSITVTEHPKKVPATRKASYTKPVQKRCFEHVMAQQGRPRARSVIVCE